MNKTRIYSAVATAIICAAVILMMVFSSVTLDPTVKEWPPRHKADITVEEYAELLDLPMSPVQAADDPSRAYSEEPLDNNSSAAPEGGMDVVDDGLKGDAPVVVTQEKPSPVKKDKKDKKVKPGPVDDTKAKREKAARQAKSELGSAFRNAGKDNTDNKGKNKGDSGRPDGKNSSVNGRGTGRVGGGWAMPSYNSVPSTVTGSVVMMVKIDRSGRVKSVTFQGGDAPAATSPEVRAACEREVRSRVFTRSDDNAPEESTAYITYRFR